MPAPHTSVLLNETLELFSEVQLRTFVDGTLGAGGHSLAILQAHPEIERLIGIDQDPIARQIASERLALFQERVVIAEGNFANLPRHLEEANIERVDGILLDLGVSSMQLDLPEKGFSFSKEAPLDMRMDPATSLTAAEIVNHWPPEELAVIFRDYGEIPSWRALVRHLVRERGVKEICTTGELVAVLKPVARSPRGRKIDPMTLIFQALRIAVNNELHVIEEVIPRAIASLRPGGRLVVISFHSLEDRIVKQLFRHAAAAFEPDPTNPMTGRKEKSPSVKLLTSKPITPSREEVRNNPRARSARLRAVERIEEEC